MRKRERFIQRVNREVRDNGNKNIGERTTYAFVIKQFPADTNNSAVFVISS